MFVNKVRVHITLQGRTINTSAISTDCKNILNIKIIFKKIKNILNTNFL